MVVVQVWLDFIKKIKKSLRICNIWRLIIKNMIIFESILTTFEVSIIFWGIWAVLKIGSSNLKPNHHKQIKPNHVKHVKICKILDCYLRQFLQFFSSRIGVKIILHKTYRLINCVCPHFFGSKAVARSESQQTIE